MSELLIKLWQNGILQLGIWETVYMTLISTFFAYLIGLPVGLILRMTDRDGIHPIGWLNRTLGIIVNALRSIPFIILMVAMLPVAKFVVGTRQPRRDRDARHRRRPVCGAHGRVRRQGGGRRRHRGRAVHGRVHAAHHLQGHHPGGQTRAHHRRRHLHRDHPRLLRHGGGLGQIAITYGYQKYDDQIVWLCVALTILIVQILQEFGMYIARRTDRRAHS